MTDYTAEIAFRGNLTDDHIDHLMGALAPFHVAVSGGTDGTFDVTLTAPAENLRQATHALLAVAEAATGEPATSIEVLATSAWDRRNGFIPVPELVSVTDAAAQLGVSRQAVLQRLESGSLAGQKVGKTWVIPSGNLG